MKKMLILAAAALAALNLTACATNVGSQAVNDFGRYQQLVNGQTNKVQVHNIFGQPHTVTHVAETKETIWQYYSIRERTNATTYIPFVGLATGGSDLDITRLDVYFDSADTLLRSQREQRSKYQNMWIGMADALTPSGQVQAVREEMAKYNLPFDEKEAKIAAGWADWDD